MILPFLEQVGLDPAGLDLVLISHADVDHFGGNAAVRAAAPRALVCAHAADIPWIESRELIMRERYGWYEGLRRSATRRACSTGSATRWAPTCPSTSGSSATKRSGSGPELVVDVLHLPGHSPGHIGLWEPRSRTAIVQDAVLARRPPRHRGERHPPAAGVSMIAEYERSAQLLQAAEAGPAADRALRRDRRRRRRAVPGRHARLRRSCPCRSQAGARRATREHARRSARRVRTPSSGRSAPCRTSSPRPCGACSSEQGVEAR